ncbi:glutaminyl-peptide cyclotransferase [Phenylobacterium sp.]|uniref:glutaminyl-peptide cyclotransferase n=1 Tax=Phenylobacterium sp. TaxID=1871053 RepID=UPI0012158A09|nr:glutaminyl-peptide cyclotransferase [Phenylobacterium sp.]THD62973.1 MAG: glutaminyl-peptide cyclotransferase [Phenylobacterium sp.]
MLGAALIAALLAWPAAAAVPVGGVQVVRAYPHDPGAFTEGLFYLKGELFESTGMPGQSNVRRVRLADGAVLQLAPIAPNLFGEGIVNWGDEIVSLTWQNHIGFRWDRKTLTQKKTFSYPGEGWALTQDGKHLIMSDGTASLRVLDPLTFKELKRIPVTADGRPVDQLNELEWVKGEILANIWQTKRIARIDPATGHVKGWIDLFALPETQGGGNPDAVANGIAYDREHDRLFVTGKYWPHLYEVKLTPPARTAP